MFICFTGWPRPRLTWYHENTVLDATYQLLTDNDHNSRRYRRRSNNQSTTTVVTVNRLLLTNLTRWHPIMSQRQQAIGKAKLTCQASNSIATAVPSGSSNLFNRPPINVPPPAKNEHTFIRLNCE